MSHRLGGFLFKNRGIFPIFLLIVGILMDYARRPLSLQGSYERWVWVCFMLACAGEAVRVYTVGHTPKGTSGRNTAGQVADSLNTAGIYSVTRNPLYLGNFLIWAAVALLFQNLMFLVFFLLFFTWFYAIIIRLESGYLYKKHHKQYIDWSGRVPVFFPGIRGFVPNVQKFNLYKVFRKEKNGIVAILGTFAFVRAVRWQIHHHTWPWTAHDKVWAIIGAIGVLQYIAVKILARHTDWLNNR